MTSLPPMRVVIVCCSGCGSPHKVLNMEDRCKDCQILVDDAADAIEEFGEDELGRYAAELNRRD